MVHYIKTTSPPSPQAMLEKTKNIGVTTLLRGGGGKIEPTLIGVSLILSKIV